MTEVNPNIENYVCDQDAPGDREINVYVPLGFCVSLDPGDWCSDPDAVRRTVDENLLSLVGAACGKIERPDELLYHVYREGVRVIGYSGFEPQVPLDKGADGFTVDVKQGGLSPNGYYVNGMQEAHVCMTDYRGDPVRQIAVVRDYEMTPRIAKFVADALREHARTTGREEWAAIRRELELP